MGNMEMEVRKCISLKHITKTFYEGFAKRACIEEGQGRKKRKSEASQDDKVSQYTDSERKGGIMYSRGSRMWKEIGLAIRG